MPRIGENVVVVYSVVKDTIGVGYANKNKTMLTGRPRVVTEDVMEAVVHFCNRDGTVENAKRAFDFSGGERYMFSVQRLPNDYSDSEEN